MKMMRKSIQTEAEIQGMLVNQAGLGSTEEQQNAPRFNIRPGSPHGLLEFGGTTAQSAPSHIDGRQTSQSDGDVPRSDDHDPNFIPLVYHVTAKDLIQYTDQEGLSNRLGHKFLSQNNVNDGLIMGAKAVERNLYSADKFKSRNYLDASFERNPAGEIFLEAETTNDQLKLLLEVRGREIDRVMEKLSKVESDNTCTHRILQRLFNLLASENESKQSNLKHYHNLVSEKDEMIKKLKQDYELQKKNLSDDVIKKIRLELESEKSTIASLECQITHSRQNILEFQLGKKSHQERLEKNIKILEQELQRAKDVEGNESVCMYDIFGEVISAEDYIAGFGITRILNCDDRVAREITKGNKEPMSEAQIQLKTRQELKVKTDEIARLQEETRKTQDLCRAQSGLKSSQVEIKELKDNSQRLKLELVEKPMQGSIRGETSPSLKEVQSENILKQEVLLLLGLHRHLKRSTQEFSSMNQSARKNALDSIQVEGPNGPVSGIDRVLKVTTDLNECISNLEKYRVTISQLREEICKLHEESRTWKNSLSNMKGKLVVSSQMIEIAKFIHSNAYECLKAQNVLKTLYLDNELQMKALKENVYPISEKTAQLQGRLASLKLELERENEKKCDLIRNNEALQVDIVVIKQKKDEKCAALQNCQDTNLKFHEDVMKELETKYNVEYETIGAQLKHEITRLAEELSNVKGLYTAVCEENSILEERFIDYVRKLEYHSVSAVSIDSRVKLCGGGGGLDASSRQDRKIKELESKGTDEQNIWEIVSKKLTIEKEPEKKYHEISKKAEEMQKKCSILECNRILEDKIGDSEDTARTKPNILLPDGACANEFERCEVLTREKNKFEKEKDEQNAQYSREISDLKENLARVDRMRAVIFYLKRERREEQKKFEKSKMLLVRNICILNDEQSELKNQLKEVQSKYIKLKKSFTAYKKASAEQRSYYKGEISRINSAFSEAKDLLKKRAQEYFENLKSQNIKGVEVIINASKDMGDERERIKPILLMLQELKIQMRDKTLKFF